MSQQDKPKRTFSSVFSNRVYGASKAAGFPKKIEGLMFFKTEAVALDAKNPEKVKRYSKAKLGNAFVLNEDKMKRIMEILSEGCEEPEKIGNGLKANE